LEIAAKDEVLIRNASADVLRPVQPNLAQLHRKPMKLVTDLGAWLKLICAGQCDAGTIDHYFDDQTLLLLRIVQRPALQDISIEAGNGTAQ
jgi:hypothetical protein